MVLMLVSHVICYLANLVSIAVRKIHEQVMLKELLQLKETSFGKLYSGICY